MAGKDFQLQRHLKLWEEQNKSVKRIIIAALLFTILLPIKVLDPFVYISQDLAPVENKINKLKQEQQEANDLKKKLEHVQNTISEVKETIKNEPWMKEKDRLIQTLSDIREQSLHGGNWDEYQAAADNTIRTIAAQVRELIIQPLEGVVQKNKRTRETMPKLSGAVDRLRNEMGKWEEWHVGRRWYQTFFAKDREMRELTYSLESLLEDISSISCSALSGITAKQEELSRKTEFLDQNIVNYQEKRDSLDEEMQKIFPQWLRGIISIEQMIHLFPVFVIFLVVVIMALALMLTGHFEKAAAIMELEKKQRTDPVSSSIWTLTYRKIHGTALTILTYLVLMAVMWRFFEWGEWLLNSWLEHNLDGEWIPHSICVGMVSWIGRLVFMGAGLLIVIVPIYRGTTKR